jgi:serine/threonine protein kinase
MSDQWQKVSELFHATLEIPIDKRAAFLQEACGTDDSLRKEVEELLEAHLMAGGFIEAPALKNVLKFFSDSEDHLIDGQRIGAYQIIREIGRGGMGAVYLAARADKQFEKNVAIKLIKRGMDTDSILKRFQNERQILAFFDHPNIARLLDSGTIESGLPYFVMEYVEGQPIDSYCDANSLSITQRLEIFRQVCAAVSYAHRHLVIHRDIKPSNIVVTTEGVPKLLDFGIAKILDPTATEGGGSTATGIRPMTPEYASPEQALGVPVSTISDVYSMGVVLYEILTGRLPYSVEDLSPIEIARVITDTNPLIPSDAINKVEACEDKSSVTLESISKTREGTPERLRRRLRGDLDNIVLKAIRKEPERRYQSVEQFSEDIRRHLAGLPVLARKDTLLYRTAKFARRNKMAVAIAVFAFIAIIISALVAGIIQWRANQQAKYLQEFGQEAARMEGIMRFAYELPLHNITSERNYVEGRIRAISSRMEQLGGSAFGPGHYAIGRGLMALQEYAEARKHFESAIKEYGYKTPEVSYAYGLTLSLLYQNELVSVSRIPSIERREMRMKEIQREFKDAALFNIREGREAAEYSEYAEAVIDFLDEDYKKAIQKSEQAIKHIPWLYESNVLEGESYRSLGRQLAHTGRNSDALSLFAKAEDAFARSIEKGGSDPRGYVGLCNAKANILFVQIQIGGPAQTTYSDGKKACENAYHSNPKASEVYLASSALNRLWAGYLYVHEGADIRSLLEDAVRASKESVRWEPGNSTGYWELGSTYQQLADYYVFHQMDPKTLVDSGIQSLERAIQLNPNYADAYYVAGGLCRLQAQYFRKTGGDPRPALEHARQFLQKAIQLNPNSSDGYYLMGNILSSKGGYEADSGLDARASLDSAMRAYKKSVKLNPGSLNAWNNLGFVALVKAEYLLALGSDPTDALNQSEKAYHRTLELNPNYPQGLKGLAHAAWRRGEFLVNTKADPSKYVGEASAKLDQAISLNNKDQDSYAIHGEVALVAGRWEMQQRNSPEDQFRSAVEWDDKALKVNTGARYFESWYSKARVFRHWAEWKLGSGKNANQEIQHGLEMVSKALEINPRSGEMIALRGIFLLFQARSISNDSQRRELLQESRSNLQKALNINANLSHEFKPSLKEVEEELTKLS